MTRSNNHSQQPGERAISHAFRPSALRLLVAAIQIGSLGLAATGMAHAQPAVPAAASQQQQAMYELDIPAQPLASAIAQFSSQTGADLFSDGVGLGGLSSSAVTGRYTLADGLQQLLAGTGLGFRYQAQSSNGRPTIQLVAQGQALELAPINIEGQQQAGTDRDSIYRTPGSVHKVTREQLDRVAYSRPGDIFQGVPGVTAGNTANGAGLELNIRGLQGMGRVRTLVDGAIQSTSNYRGYAGQREETYVDPDLLASVDIRKGPEAGPEGAGAIGGVVNMRTLSANDLITDPDKNWGLRIRGMHGNNVASGDVCSDGNYFGPFGDCRDRESGRVTSLYNNSAVVFTGKDIGTNMGSGMPDHNRSGSIAGAWRPLDNWDITLGYAKRESGNYYSGKRGADSWKGLGANMADQEVKNTSLVSESTLLKTSVRFLDDHSLGLNYRKYRSKSGMVDSTGKMITGDNWQNALSEVDSETHGLDYAWQPDSPWFNVQAHYWNTRVSESHYQTHSDSQGLSLQNTSTATIPALGRLAVKYGGSFSEEEANSTNVLNSGGSRDTTGLFITGDWQLTPWLALHAGLQHDKVKLEDGLKRGGDDYSDHQYEHTSPSYGITLTPWSGVQLFARWSEGMRAPALRETYYQVSSTYANPSLKPEYAKNFEYGINLLFDDLLLDSDYLGVKFAVFDNKYDDYIARVTRASLGEFRANGRPESGYRYANIDKARYKGYELSVDYDAGWLFSNFVLTHYDDIKYCYASTSGSGANTVVNPSACYHQPPSSDFGANYVPPRQEKSATLGVRLLDRKLVLGTRMKMSTDSLYGGSFRGSYIGETVWDNYEIYDLFGSYQAMKHLELGFSVENLRDRFYLSNMTNSLEAIPSPGRTTRLTLTAQF